MTQIVAMCNAFVLCGHEVTLLVTDRKTSIKEDPATFYGTPINFHVSRITVPDIAGMSPKIPPFARPYLFFVQRLIFTIRSAWYIRANIFDIVYGRDEWVLWMLSYLLSIPLIWESHEAKYSRIAKALIYRTKKLIVISEGIRDFYVQKGVPSEKMIVAHDAVDERFFTPHISSSQARTSLGITTEKPVVMYIGGLDLWKGVDTLFEACANTDTYETYVIGGKEEELEEYKKRYPHVHFLGPRPYKELPQHQQAADVLAIPNTAKNAVSAEFTSPLKLFAHMTARKPIVASRIPSITNVLRDTDAYFFTPDDPIDLHRVMVQVISDTDHAFRKADAAFKKSEKYTWFNRAKEIVEFLCHTSSPKNKT